MSKQSDFEKLFDEVRESFTKIADEAESSFRGLSDELSRLLAEITAEVKNKPEEEKQILRCGHIIDDPILTTKIEVADVSPMGLVGWRIPSGEPCSLGKDLIESHNGLFLQDGRKAVLPEK